MGTKMRRTLSQLKRRCLTDAMGVGLRWLLSLRRGEDSLAESRRKASVGQCERSRWLAQGLVAYA